MWRMLFHQGVALMPRSCDTMVALGPTTAGGHTLFAKNSDRPADECQPLVLQERRSHAPGAVAACLSAWALNRASAAGGGCSAVWGGHATARARSEARRPSSSDRGAGTGAVGGVVPRRRSR